MLVTLIMLWYLLSCVLAVLHLLWKVDAAAWLIVWCIIFKGEGNRADLLDDVSVGQRSVKLMNTLTTTRTSRIKLLTHVMELFSCLSVIFFSPFLPPSCSAADISWIGKSWFKFCCFKKASELLWRCVSCVASVLCAGRALQMEDDLVISFQLLLCTLELIIKRCSPDLLQRLYSKLQ